MLVFTLRRLLFAIPLLIAASLIVFLVVNSFPGDPCLAKLGQRASASALADCRANLNLDGPLLERYGTFLKGAVVLDFGDDLYSGEDVGGTILERLQPTLELSLVALLIAFLIGMYVGTRSALRPGSWMDALGQVLSLGGVSVPVFWLGLMLISLFGIQLGWLPFSGWSERQIGPDIDYSTGCLLFESLFRLEFAAFGRALQHIALPAIALSTIPLATITRMARSAMLEEIGKDYVTTARAKGLDEKRVIRRHVRRNALIPVVTITGLQLGTLLSGAVLTETVFSWPGLGNHMLQAAEGRNYPVIMGCMLLFVTTFIVINLVVDLLYAWIDPRLRLENR